MSTGLPALPRRGRLRLRRPSIGACGRTGLPLSTGAVQNGLAGAGTAAATDAFSTVRNPAAGARLDTQLALGLDIGLPDGSVRAGDPGTGPGVFSFSAHSQQSVSGVLPGPQFAYNRRLTPRSAWGLSLSVAGLAVDAGEGSATFAGSIPAISAHCEGLLGGGRPLPGSPDRLGLCGDGRSSLKLQLAQAFLAADYAYTLDHGLSLGLAPVLAIQALRFDGFKALAHFSNDPAATSDRGHELSWGFGGRLGLLWQLTDTLAVGAAYQTRIRMSDSDRYAGLLPGAALDVPSSLHGGIALGAAAGQRLLLDVEYIRYEDSRPLSNPVDAPRLTEQCLLPRLARLAIPLAPDTGPSPACFGGAQGPGLGWRNLTVYKAGYESTQGPLRLRLGYAQSRRPMAADQALPSMVAPATSRRHLAAGLSWTASTRWGIDLVLQRALPEAVEGRNPLSQVQLQLQSPPVEAGTDDSDQRLRSELDLWQFGLGLRRHFASGSAR
jgi:long-chain fatty acid transport protein